MTRHLRLSTAFVSLILNFFGWNQVRAQGTLQIGSDPFTNSGSQHLTEVEPQVYANGSTIVATFQQGRTFEGGSSDVGFSTSTDSGLTWQEGSLPGITVWAGGDRYDRVSDPSIAYNAAFGVWLIVTLPVGNGNREIFVSRSGDGLNWDDPITVYSADPPSSFDKTWMTCDNSPVSSFFGNCYIEWDDVGRGGVILMSASTDGGATWALPLNTADHATGLGGQPLVQPSGRVVVPYTTYSSVRAFISDDGGSSWSSSVSAAAITEHPVAGGLRDFNLPSAAIDGDGLVYVVWTDCRFRFRCGANDVVMMTSSDGVSWSGVTRVPIDDIGSSADHFLGAIGADRNSFAPNTGLTVLYYYYPVADCTTETCQLVVGFMTSSDGGNSWSDPADLAGPMSLSWLPSTISGLMVGDYFSVVYTDEGVPHPVFAAATEPIGTFFESMFSTCAGCATHARSRAEIAAESEVASSAAGSVAAVNDEWQPGPAQSETGALRVSAEAYRVNIGTVLPLSASGPAAESFHVLWEVEEGATGGSVSGGVYTAPLSPGLYHLVARAGAEKARLAIKVFTVQ